MLPDALLTDCHAHLADGRLADCLPQVLQRCAGMGGVVVNAAQMADWETIGKMMEDVPTLQGAVGIHPWYAAEETLKYLQVIDNQILAKSEKWVAIGEIGLDFVVETPSRKLQMEVMAAQVRLAVRHSLPVCLHIRKAWSTFFDLFKTLGLASLKGYCHNFTGSRETARRLLDAGLHLSFGGQLTWPEARRAREAAVYVPADSILVETDCPVLPSFSHKVEPSLPWHVAETLECMAELRHMKAETLAQQVLQNFQGLFG